MVNYKSISFWCYRKYFKVILELHFRRLHWRPNRLIQSRELFGHFLVHRDFSSPVQQRNWIWSNNNYLYFKHYFQLFDLVQSDWDRTHHFWSFLGLAVRCLKRVQWSSLCSLKQTSIKAKQSRSLYELGLLTLPQEQE